MRTTLLSTSKLKTYRITSLSIMLVILGIGVAGGVYSLVRYEMLQSLLIIPVYLLANVSNNQSEFCASGAFLLTVTRFTTIERGTKYRFLSRILRTLKSKLFQASIRSTFMNRRRMGIPSCSKLPCGTHLTSGGRMLK
jgi:uncharacterized membrane protein YedE/YeeE